MLSFQKKKKALVGLLLFLTAFFSTPLRVPKTTLAESKITGTGHFHPETIKTQASAFHHSLLWKGTLRSFDRYSDLPCHIYLPLNAKLPKGHCDYAIEGSLEQKAEHLFVLKPTKNKEWKEIEGTHTLALLRHQMKQALKNQIKKEIRDKSAQTLLTALATVEIDERLLSLEFGKIGLQHILAISGFHFGLIALFLRGIFRSFLPPVCAYALLLVALTGYYLFLGNAPSIQRAYVAIALVILGKFFSLKISGLNALGAALLIEVGHAPLCCTELSFQLTFLCTLGILLFYAPMHALCKKVLPERTKTEIQELTPWKNHSYLLTSFLRKSLAINLSVTLISLPLLLHFFHRFPLLSLFYNLFFPACICLSLLLLCTALLLTPLIPFVGHFLHSLNNGWTKTLLKITANPPAVFDFVLRTNRLDFISLIFFLTGGIFLAILFFERERLSKNVL